MPEPSIQLSVIYEDNHIIAINKRAGDIVQGDITGDKPLNEIVKDYIKEKYNKPGEVYLGTPHRIDRPTSGVILFAKTSKALTRLNKLFHDKEVQKTYWAIVKEVPHPTEGHLIHYLKKNQQKNKSFASTNETKGSKKAELTYKVIHKFKNYALVEVKPLTGRHHQIRVQLASIGSPLKGDLKYGFARSNPDGSIGLHARTIEFIHPVKKEPLSIKANPLSKDPLWQEATLQFSEKS